MQENEFRLIIQGAIEFLAPYFKISKEQLKSFPIPSLAPSPDKTPYFDSLYNQFLLNPEHYHEPKNIGHEAGHYLHFHLNRQIWRIDFNKWGDLIQDEVAYFAEYIFINKGKQFKKPIINLPVLARKDYESLSNKHLQGKLKSLAVLLADALNLELAGELKGLVKVLRLKN